ncbi:hypothetical protein [Methylobacterium sp. D48H]
MSAETDPPPPIDPVEALKRIRALIEGSCETTYGTRAEPIIQMIQQIVDKALPPKRRRRVTKP